MECPTRFEQFTGDSNFGFPEGASKAGIAAEEEFIGRPPVPAVYAGVMALGFNKGAMEPLGYSPDDYNAAVVFTEEGEWALAIFEPDEEDFAWRNASAMLRPDVDEDGNVGWSLGRMELGNGVTAQFVSDVVVGGAKTVEEVVERIAQGIEVRREMSQGALDYYEGGTRGELPGGNRLASTYREIPATRTKLVAAARDPLNENEQGWPASRYRNMAIAMRRLEIYPDVAFEKDATGYGFDDYVVAVAGRINRIYAGSTIIPESEATFCAVADALVNDTLLLSDPRIKQGLKSIESIARVGYKRRRLAEGKAEDPIIEKLRAENLEMMERLFD